ncbi:hypothetical protein FSP39_006409, partial [Pinctada imbricata]
SKKRLLWKFLLDELNSHNDYLRWIDRSAGTFRIIDTMEVSKRWGKIKHNPAMTFGKLSRGLRIMKLQRFRIMYLYFSILLSCEKYCVSSVSIADVAALRTSLFDVYDNELQPSYEYHMNISLYFFPFSIHELDEVSGTLTSVVALSTQWKDQRLSWNPLNYNGTYYLNVKSSKIWYPDIFCINPADKLEKLGDNSLNAMIYSHGVVERLIGAALKTSCVVDMTYFPFDTQICSIIFSTWNLALDVKINIFENSVILTYYTKNPQWELIRARTRNINIGVFSGIPCIDLTLQRKSEFFVLNSLVPILLLLILNPLVFVLPIESGERVSFAVTIFLSLAVFMTLVSDNTPKSASLSLITYIMMTVMVCSTCQCIMIIVIFVFYFKNANSRAPKWLVQMTCAIRCRKERQTTPFDEETDNMGKRGDGGSTSVINEDFSWKDFAVFLDKISFVLSCCVLLIIVIVIVSLISQRPAFQ